MHFLVRKLILALIFATILVAFIALARGYRFSLTQGSISSTGILVASSNPDGAKILVDGKLSGATNSNIVLAPGKYSVEIKKDGFTSWKKDITIKGELVLKADALLFPQNPTLAPVTSLGVTRAFSSPSGDKIIIVSETGDIEEDGIYMFENVRNPLSRINPLNTLVLKSSFRSQPAGFSLNSIKVEFSPDEKEMLMTVDNTPLSPTLTPTPSMAKPPESQNTSIYLLNTNSLTESLFDVTASVESIREVWKQEASELRSKTLKGFKKPLAKVAQESFNILSFSPDETKILYTATQSATLPRIIKPALIATNQTPETRTIEPNNVYVYDAEEDRNYLIPASPDSIIWYPSSAHLVLKEAQNIAVVDYDGTNRRTVYSGPFDHSFIASSKDGRLFILTNFNSENRSIFDIYSVGIN
jgi:hypothetical protein